MMAKVTLQDLQVAAEWLAMYEDAPGAEGEAAGCQRVAAMLRKMVERRLEDAAIREKTKETGFTQKQLRTALKWAKHRQEKGKTT